MNHTSLSMQTTNRDEQRGERDTRLHGHWLALMRVIWVVIVVLSVGLFIVGVPFSYAASQAICATAPCNTTNQLTLDQVHELQHLGLSLEFYALFVTVLAIIFEIGYIATGILIFWRKSDERVALVASFYLVTFGAAFQGSNLLLTLNPVYRVLSLGLAFIGNVCVGLFFYLFPTGRFAPRWTRWLLAAWIAYWGYTNLLSGSILTGSGVIDSLLFLGFLASIVAIQVYRYRRVSTPMQRRQTKWVVYGLSVALVGFLLLITVGFGLSLHLGIIAYLVAGVLLYFFLLLIPISFGVAILRSRLFDIDVLINRTLVYLTLTASLAVIYIGSIIALQSLLRGIINQDNSAAIVVSTLVIAALFQPLRHRIQAIIDRRFYRRKYDAASTLAAFSATLRNEVDLSHLSEHLLNVVQETMQPSHVSLWVRQPGRMDTRSLQVDQPPLEEAGIPEEIAKHGGEHFHRFM
ncbi:MAG TPA: hypothetical protein VF043_33215 [Ktedonobacteraceae bacterium]